MTSPQQTNTVEILWTGGFDSTFRIVQLSRLPVKIQPVYLLYPEKSAKQSANIELASIVKITSLLVKHPQTQCEFLPLRIIELSDFPINEEISKAYQRLLKKEFLGAQYVKLGSYAINHPGLELSIHKEDKAIYFIQKYGKLIQKTDETTEDYFILKENETDEDVYTLFKYYRFPVVEMTKIQMKSLYMDWGYESVMNITWFCHTPVHNKPCGSCNPCQYTIEEGLSERFTKLALFRYRCKRFLSPLHRLRGCALQIIKKIIRR